jgi:hypothetical protein
MKQIVFTRYGEPSTSIMDVYTNTNATVFVYDRGSKKLELPSDSRLIHVHDENRGREEGGYLRHIIDNYDTISGTVVFSQALNDNHSSHFTLDGNFSDWVNSLDNPVYKSYITRELNCSRDGSPWHMGLPLEAGWNHIFGSVPLPDQFTFFPCGIFATNAETIRKHPKEFYQNILDLVSRPENCVIHSGLQLPWCLERLWGYIFA